MGRYLLFLSYLGTHYGGIQKQVNPPVKTVVGELEEVIKLWLRPANEAQVHQSSRTDAGVHALCNTAHVDIQHRIPNHNYHPDVVSSAINEGMWFRKEPIRILKTLRVDDSFHARFAATGRTYVYRIAVLTKPFAPGLSWAAAWPTMECEKICPIWAPCDVDKLREAAEIYTGTHDFTCFTNKKRLTDEPGKNPVKTMKVTIEEGSAFMDSHLYHTDYHNHFKNYDIIFHGNSFLFRQVRRMTSVMLAYATGQIEISALRKLMDNPEIYGETVERDKIILSHLNKLPPYGLYLKNVHYNDKDYRFHAPDDGSTIDTNVPCEGVPIKGDWPKMFVAPVGTFCRKTKTVDITPEEFAKYDTEQGTFSESGPQRANGPPFWGLFQITDVGVTQRYSSKIKKQQELTKNVLAPGDAGVIDDLCPVRRTNTKGLKARADVFKYLDLQRTKPLVKSSTLFHKTKKEHKAQLRAKADADKLHNGNITPQLVKSHKHSVLASHNKASESPNNNSDSQERVIVEKKDEYTWSDIITIAWRKISRNNR